MTVDISGPYLDRGRWTLRWQDPTTGKARCFSRCDRAAVDARRAELLAQAPGTPAGAGPVLGPLQPFDGTVAWVKQALATALEASTRATEVGDSKTLAAIRKHIGNLKDALAAWQPFGDHAETQEALEKLVLFHETNGWGREHEGLHDAPPVTPELAAGLGGESGPWAGLSPPPTTKDN